MAQMIFVNLPVANLKASRAFYEAIGAVNEPKFTDDNAACMVISDSIFVMLLTHDFFKGFTDKQIPDAKKTCQVLLCISRDSREAVDTIAEQAITAGGRETREPQDMAGMMYSRSFEAQTAMCGSRCGWTPPPPNKARPRSRGPEPWRIPGSTAHLLHNSPHFMQPKPSNQFDFPPK